MTTQQLLRVGLTLVATLLPAAASQANLTQSTRTTIPAGTTKPNTKEFDESEVELASSTDTLASPTISEDISMSALNGPAAIALLSGGGLAFGLIARRRMSIAHA